MNRKHWIYVNLLRPAYYVFIRGFLGAFMIFMVPGLVLQLFIGGSNVALLMGGPLGYALLLLALLWFGTQFYRGMRTPQSVEGPRET